MSHTPGPWKVDKEGFIWGRCPGGCRMEVSDFPVAEIRGTGHLQYRPDGEDMQAANARLIAAAPELLDELYEILDYAREVYAWYGGDEENRGRAPRIKADLDRVEALLNRLCNSPEIPGICP